MTVAPDHPRQVFSFYLSDDFSDDDVAQLQRLVVELGSERPWTLGQPRFDDHTDVPRTGNPADEPVRTVGGWIELYSAWPPYDDALPIEIDRAHFQEVTHIMSRLTAYSRDRRQDIAFQLDDVYLGDLCSGQLDEGLRRGFLGEWEKRL